MSEDLAINLQLFAPELLVVGVLTIFFLLDGLVPSTRSNAVPFILTGLACIGGFILSGKTFTDIPKLYFSGMLSNDSLTMFFRYFFFFACFAAVYLSFGSKELKSKNRMEFCILLLCVLFGLCLMAGATHLLTLYIGLETVSIVSFVMAGFDKDNIRANEASFKYLVYGALASGVMLYGMSLLYGIAGSLHYHEIAKFLTAEASHSPFSLSLTLILIYAGVAYKISAFPLHFWTPDIYEGAPTPVATFFSVGPKAAGMAALIRGFATLFAVNNGSGQWTLSPFGENIAAVLAMLSAFTMVIGNFSAIGQINVKRLLAYSSIAQVGYLLMAFVTPDLYGIGTVFFYLIAYCVMNIGAFWVVSIVHDLKGNTNLEDFNGLGWQMPVLGTCMAVFLFSLAGIPLFSGFIGKFLIFGAVIKTPGYLWLALLGVLNSVVSLYYYAKVLKALFLVEPSPNAEKVRLSLYHGVALVGLAVPTVVMGVYFTPVLKFVEKSLSAFH